MEGSRGGEKRILVHARKDKYEDGRMHGIPYEEGGRLFPVTELHMVDLHKDKITLHFTPQLLEYVTTSTILVSEKVVYVFGGLNPLDIRTSEFKELVSRPPKLQRNLFLGGSRLFMDPRYRPGGGVWLPAPAPVSVQNRCYQECSSLSGDLYTFGFWCLEPEVFDPFVGHWIPVTPLPPELVGCVVSFYPIPDPSNNRFLLRLYDGKLPSPAIYSFTPLSTSKHSTPCTGTWECLATDFNDWTRAAALLDDVIYFHSRKFDGVVRAFDLVEGTWLDVHWSSCFDDNVDMNITRMHFDAMFALDHNILCLALWYHDDKPNDNQTTTTTLIFFRKFKVERSDKTVTFVPISSHSFELPATSQVVHFVPC